MNLKTNVNTGRSGRAKAWRHNPLKNLQPETLTGHLDAFESGQLRTAANIWEHLEQRDDVLRSVVAKRKKSVARHGWVVLPVEGLNEEEKEQARAHTAALEYFYRHLACENALDANEQGGFKLLARQMMDAVGKRFAVHEMVWQVRREEGRSRMTGTFRFIPLAFFENTTGRLRFLETEGALEGVGLEPGGWLVTVGEGLMAASSLAWMVKQTALDAWILFCERNGQPGLTGLSSAVRDSEEWKALGEALTDLQDGLSVTHGTNDEIRVLDLAPGGSIPFPALIERMDRMMAVLWRGADLSTLSRERGYGASLQEKETCALEEDDAEMLTETLNRQVDDWVIRHSFGPTVKALAHVKVLTSPRECTSEDIQVDEFLLRHGAPLALEETLHRYGRKPAGRGERVLGVDAAQPVEERVEPSTIPRLMAHSETI